jgi:hypothetical protein
MVWENPIKSVDLRFFRTGAQTEMFFPAGSPDAVTALASFLESSDAAILGMDNFSADESPVCCRGAAPPDSRSSRALAAPAANPSGAVAAEAMRAPPEPEGKISRRS